MVVFNHKAGSARTAAALRQQLAARGDVTLYEPDSPDDTRRRTARAKEEGFDLIVAAGGDGTIHAVVNGLAPDFGRARLAVLPLGTGNDLRRSLAIPDDPLAALDLLDAGRERLIDVIRVETPDRSLYAVNTASGGFSGQLREALTEEMKAAWGPLAYLRGAAAVLPDLTDYRTTLELDDGPPERVEALNVIVANGRFAAHGWHVAPRADLEDGLLDVVVVRYGPLFDLTAVAARLLTGDYVDGAHVLLRRARRSPHRLAAGHVVQHRRRARRRRAGHVHGRAAPLRVIVGPEYRSEASATLPAPKRSAG